MPLTAIDPTPALIIVDLQKGVVGRPTVHPIEGVIARSAELAEGFRRHGLPVVLVNVTGRAPGRTDSDAASAAASRMPTASDAADIVDELDPQASDHRITKQTWGAFHGTGLHDLLRGLGVTQVVVTGVATSIGVETTARAAYEHGYNVVLALDAMTDLGREAHDNSVKWIFPRLGETATTAQILAMLGASR